jgi:hypothetical protein
MTSNFRKLFGLVIAICATVAFASSSAAFAADCPGTGLLQKTQAFSDAGQRGDGAAMGRMLDDRVVFFNEGGDSATKADMAQSGSPPRPNGISVTMKVMDFNCERHGDVAVTSFIDDQVLDGLVHMHAQYRSVETWLREAGDWKMIGSETIALNDDPPSIKLPPQVLDEYVGTYRSATGQTFTFTRSGDQLMASTQGSPPTAQSAEVKDVFFTPGRARFRKVFERDSSGHVIAFASRREGHDTVFTRV